jgi:hypothetical protein
MGEYFHFHGAALPMLTRLYARRDADHPRDLGRASKLLSTIFYDRIPRRPKSLSRERLLRVTLLNPPLFYAVHLWHPI